MREHLVLADERGGDVLGDHEARVEPAVGREERREAVRERRVVEPLDPTLGDVRELGDRDRERVERERHRLAVEVPVGDELVASPRGRAGCRWRVQLDRDRRVRVVEQVAARAVHLRRAAQRVGVLHLVAPAVGLDDRRASSRRRSSPRSRAGPGSGRSAGSRAEGRRGALERLERERARDVGDRGEAARAHAAERAHGRHVLRPVDEREPLLGAQRTGSSSARASASPPGAVRRRRRPSPRPRAGARGARAARGRPRRRPSRGHGTTGSTPRLRHASSSSTVSERAARVPLASAFARSTIAARTTSSGYGSPTPHAWLRRRRSCSSADSSGGMVSRRAAEAVLMPYVCSPLEPAATSSTRSRAARILSRASSERPAPVVSTATAQTSSAVRLLLVRATVSVRGMSGV